MAERQLEPSDVLQAALGIGERRGGKWRHDTVARWDHHQRRPLDLRRHDTLAADGPFALAGQVLAVPADQTLARDGACQGCAFVQPILQQHEVARLLALLIHAEEARELLHGEPGIDRPEQRLQDVDRQLADFVRHLGEQRPCGEQEGVAGLVGMEIPRRSEQRQPGDPARPALGERHAQRAAHAIAHDHRRPARAPGDEGQRPLEAGHVSREVEAPLLGIRRAPIDQVGPQAFGRHSAQQALVGGEVEHLPTIDQRRHDQHGPRAALSRRAMRRTIVEQLRIAFAPHRRRRVERPMDGTAAIGEHAFGEAVEAAADLAMEGSLEAAGIEAGDFPQNFGQRLRRRGAWPRVRRSALPELPRAL